MLSVEKLPSAPGVYIMKDAGGAIIYIGKANNIKKRVAQYFGGKRDWKTANLTALIRAIDCVPCASERDALILERRLINRHKPFFNAMWKDDKSYPHIKITKEDFPRIAITRKKIKDGALYFGPYPSSGLIKTLIKYLHRAKIGDLRPCKWNFSETKPLADKKIKDCVYFHTKQCPAPCAGRISPALYRKKSENLADFFRGDLTKVKLSLEKLMKEASAKTDYENAAMYRDAINAIAHISERVKTSLLRENEISQSVGKTNALREIAEVCGLKKTPLHIETFDASHIQGKQAIGAMVCFKEGIKYKPHYRMFKIRKNAGDDFAMIYEIVYRRAIALKKNGTDIPDLFIIDGGKGQLSAALDALENAKLRIPVISIAKKEEEIFLRASSAPVKLAKNNSALCLIMEMRDEVHRFAIAYHRKLRNKNLMG